MKKLLIIFIGIVLMMPCAAQDDGYLTMPDGSTRTMEQLILSAEDMKTYLYSLSGAEKEAAINEIMMGLNISMEQMNSLRGAALFGNNVIFDGVEFNNQNREVIFKCSFTEEINGQRYDLTDLIHNNNMDQAISIFCEQFKQNFPPGYHSTFEWLKLKFTFIIKGLLTNDVKQYSVPLY